MHRDISRRPRHTNPVRVSPLRVVLFGLAMSALPSLALAQLEPDKTIVTVGQWNISTALYGVGCVARLEYSKDGHQISISGENTGRLKLLITVDPKQFETKLDGSEQDTSNIEVALADNRWGHVKEYGYRGTSGVVLDIDSAFLNSFASSGAIKITERGHEKVRIELNEPKAVIAQLAGCFRREKPLSNVSPQKRFSSEAEDPAFAGRAAAIVSPSVKALEGKWYSDNAKVCGGMPGETEGLLTFENGRFIGYENNCKIHRSKTNGRFLAILMICDGEGMQSRDSEIVEFLNDRQIKRHTSGGGKRYSFIHTRCP
jgi:hypothetical protein